MRCNPWKSASWLLVLIQPLGRFPVPPVCFQRKCVVSRRLCYTTCSDRNCRANIQSAPLFLTRRLSALRTYPPKQGRFGFPLFCATCTTRNIIPFYHLLTKSNFRTTNLSPLNSRTSHHTPSVLSPDIPASPSQCISSYAVQTHTSKSFDLSKTRRRLHALPRDCGDKIN